MADMTSAVTTSLTEVSANIMSVLGDVAPIALGIVGAVMVVTFGVKFFKKLAK